MTVIVVPTVLLWVLIVVFALNAAASLRVIWLRWKLKEPT